MAFLATASLYHYGDKTSSSIALQRLLFQPNWPHKRGHSIAEGAKNRDKIKVAIRLSPERLWKDIKFRHNKVLHKTTSSSTPVSCVLCATQNTYKAKVVMSYPVTEY